METGRREGGSGPDPLTLLGSEAFPEPDPSATCGVRRSISSQVQRRTLVGNLLLQIESREMDV